MSEDKKYPQIAGRFQRIPFAKKGFQIQLESIMNQYGRKREPFAPAEYFWNDGMEVYKLYGLINMLLDAMPEDIAVTAAKEDAPMPDALGRAVQILNNRGYEAESKELLEFFRNKQATPEAENNHKSLGWLSQRQKTLRSRSYFHEKAGKFSRVPSRKDTTTVMGVWLEASVLIDDLLTAVRHRDDLLNSAIEIIGKQIIEQCQRGLDGGLTTARRALEDIHDLCITGKGEDL